MCQSWNLPYNNNEGPIKLVITALLDWSEQNGHWHIGHKDWRKLPLLCCRTRCVGVLSPSCANHGDRRGGKLCKCRLAEDIEVSVIWSDRRSRDGVSQTADGTFWLISKRRLQCTMSWTQQEYLCCNDEKDKFLGGYTAYSTIATYCKRIGSKKHVVKMRLKNGKSRHKK